jgi:N-6 DNA Methylase
MATIRSEGGLLPADILSRVAALDRDLGGLAVSDFHLAPNERLGEAIARSWARLSAAWDVFSRERDLLQAGDHASRVTRERWLLPLFSELGYGRLIQQPGVEIDGKSYAVFCEYNHSPVHVVGAGVPLDRRTSGVRGAADQSPHSLVQELLNRSAERLWGILTNGLSLRLLRDNVTLTRQAYVEFDVEAMFATEGYEDFALLWLCTHQSRLEAETPEKCWLERWTQAAQRDGTRALGELRSGVERAIEALGRGFLAQPANAALHDALRDGSLDGPAYYRQLLRLIYRLLFLFVAEDRDALLLPDDGTPERHDARARYDAYYGTGRLRRLSVRRRGGRAHDLYEQIKLLTAWLHDGGQQVLALPPLGSALWDPDTTPHVSDARLGNEALLEAIRELAYVEGGRRPVDFRNLGAEELGSVYEALLELHPKIDRGTATFALSTAAGHERKTTGSYYTPTTLIATLLDASLDTLLDEAQLADDPERAILAVTVCDPACGSGHFLVAAANRIAKRLAAVRTGDAEPAPAALRAALRDVVGRCIYGVDVNPMAVELCKVSLWMEALEPGRPLTFLESHVRPGHALLGALPGLVEAGIPDDAFQAVRGDDFGALDAEDKGWVTKLRKRNADESARGRGAMTLFDPDAAVSDIASNAHVLEELPDDTLHDVTAKELGYRSLRESTSFKTLSLACDVWAAAPLAEKREGLPILTQGAIDRALDGSLSAEPAALVAALRDEYSLFHWQLEFPEVFSRGGFDLVLGNPPWDTLSPDVKEFFSTFDPQVREQDRDGQRAIVERLLENPQIAQGWRDNCRQLYASVHAFKNGGRYRLFAAGNLGKGDFNIYRMFAETALAITGPDGFTAQIVPENLANGANAAAIREELFDRRRLDLLITFENRREIWFKGLHTAAVFCLYSARRADAAERFRAAFDIRDAESLRAAEQEPLLIPRALVEEFSPDALAVMRFSSQAEIEAVSKAYARCPRFGDKTAGEPYRDYMREIDMGNDRELFVDGPGGLPLYEGRMVAQYDHRAKGYRSGRGRAAVWEPLDFDDATKSIQPQWRIAAIPAKAADRVQRYRVGFCDVASPTNERTLVAALIPPGTICGHKVPTFSYPDGYEWAYAVWLGVANSFVADFIARKKVSLTMALGVLDSLPFPRPAPSHPTARRLVPLVARLTCTSHEMLSYWQVLARDKLVNPVDDGDIPGELDEDRRLELRAEIDAIVAADVYGIDHGELEFILSTFPTTARYEAERYGEFRSARLVLDAYDSIVSGQTPTAVAS